jgi:hypothetical protein
MPRKASPPPIQQNNRFSPLKKGPPPHSRDLPVRESNVRKALKQVTTTRTVRHDVEIKTAYNRNQTSETIFTSLPLHEESLRDSSLERESLASGMQLAERGCPPTPGRKTVALRIGIPLYTKLNSPSRPQSFQAPNLLPLSAFQLHLP